MLGPGLAARSASLKSSVRGWTSAITSSTPSSKTTFVPSAPRRSLRQGRYWTAPLPISFARSNVAETSGRWTSLITSLERSGGTSTGWTSPLLSRDCRRIRHDDFDLCTRERWRSCQNSSVRPKLSSDQARGGQPERSFAARCGTGKITFGNYKPCEALTGNGHAERGGSSDRRRSRIAVEPARGLDRREAPGVAPRAGTSRSCPRARSSPRPPRAARGACRARRSRSQAARRGRGRHRGHWTSRSNLIGPWRCRTSSGAFV